MQSGWNINTEDENKVRRTRKIISVILAFVGVGIIASQVIPLTTSYIDGVIAQKE